MEKLTKSEIVPSDVSTYTTSLKADFVTEDQIGLSYNTMSGNEPNTKGNFVAIWQNQNSIPWNQAPQQVKEIATNTQSGTMSFDGLNINKNSYIIGYSVGPKLTSGQAVGNICSTVFIPARGDVNEQADFDPKLTLKFVGTTSVAFQFLLPFGITPLSNTAWCGIWRSSVPSYNNPPDQSIPVTIDAESGTLSFNDFNIGLGLTYTIALFMSGWKGYGQPNDQNAMACSLTFTNNYGLF